MGDSSIEWTDKVWNPVTGCTKVSAGCANCYAEAVAKHYWKGRPFEDVQEHIDRLKQPFHWKKPKRIFVNSMSDLFHESIAPAFIAAVFQTMRENPRHVFQVLTKRPKYMRHFVTNWEKMVGRMPDNIWLGVTVENQKTADERIPILLSTPAVIRFLSIEPMLEKIDLGNSVHLTGSTTGWNERGIHWVICGGESGPKRRPFDPEWALDLEYQCSSARVAFFMKQDGGLWPGRQGRLPDSLWRRKEFPNENISQRTPDFI